MNVFKSAKSLIANRGVVREWVEQFIGQTREPEDLLVLMLDAGWQPNCDEKHALNAVKRALGKFW